MKLSALIAKLQAELDANGDRLVKGVDGALDYDLEVLDVECGVDREEPDNKFVVIGFVYDEDQYLEAAGDGLDDDEDNYEEERE